MSADWEQLQPRSTARRLAAVAAAVAAGAVVALVAAPRDAPNAVPLTVHTPPGDVQIADASGRGGSWTVLRGGPLSPRAKPVAVWSGQEMLVWGGVSFAAKELLRDGAAFDPAADRWRPIADAPIRGRVDAAAVWTGEEMVVWGGVAEGAGALLADGAAYVPARDRWRRLPPAPLSPRQAPHAVWAAGNVVVWGGHAGDGIELDDGARYDPATNRWTRLRDGPLTGRRDWTAAVVATRGSVLIWSSAPSGAVVARHDVGSGSWQRLEAPPLDATETRVFAAVGDDVVGWGVSALGDGGPLGVTTTDGEVWTTTTGRPPYTPRGGARLLGGHDAAVSWSRSVDSGRGVAYDAASGQWRPMASPPRPLAVGWPVQVWADDRLVVWYPTASTDASNRTVAWTPQR